jgi:hypothetical protein
MKRPVVLGDLSVAAQLFVSAANAAPLPLRASWRHMPEFNTIRVRLDNTGSTALCIADVDTKEKIRFRQHGQEAFPLVEENRAMMEWRGADLIGGLVVVPPARHVELYYTLTDWQLHPGQANVEVQFPVYDCAGFFQNPSPQADLFISNTTFVMTPPRRLSH